MASPRSSVLLSLAALLAWSAPSGAQSAQRLSLQFSGLFVGVSGDAYEGLDSGPGFEAQFRFNPSAFSIGVGFQASNHTLDLGDFGSEDVMLAGGFIEPRYVFDIGQDRYAPYASARLAYLKQSIDLDIDGESVSASANGTQLNVGGGVLLRLSSRVNLDIGATIGRINFDDVEVSIPGEGTATVDGSSGSGQNLVLRVGLAIGLGR
jgi:hypothetical protein